MIEHDLIFDRKLRNGYDNLYRWNDALRRVDYWNSLDERWFPSVIHETTVNIDLNKLVTYEDTWTEPCKGTTE